MDDRLSNMEIPSSDVPSFPLQTAVAFIVFNRPECTATVFERIKAAKPPLLLVIADGPRSEKIGEADKCRRVREVIENGVDWPCEIMRNYAVSNLGCRNRVASGIDWVFEQVSEAIILEDDCLPHPDFFRFCQELLIKYRDNHGVGAICGSVPLQPTGADKNSDYYFSRHPYIWGWATWRRAWREYRVDMPDWPLIRQNIPQHWDSTPERAVEWRRMFDSVYHRKIDTWDYQWFYTNLKHRWLSAVPNSPLVRNIGFGPDATHTHGKFAISQPALTGIRIPLRHPETLIRDTMNDDAVEKINYRFPALWKRILRKIYSLLSLAAPPSVKKMPIQL